MDEAQGRNRESGGLAMSDITIRIIATTIVEILALYGLCRIFLDINNALREWCLNRMCRARGISRTELDEIKKAIKKQGL